MTFSRHSRSQKPSLLYTIHLFKDAWGELAPTKENCVTQNTRVKTFSIGWYKVQYPGRQVKEDPSLRDITSCRGYWSWLEQCDLRELSPQSAITSSFYLRTEWQGKSGPDPDLCTPVLALCWWSSCWLLHSLLLGLAAHSIGVFCFFLSWEMVGGHR